MKLDIKIKYLFSYLLGIVTACTFFYFASLNWGPEVYPEVVLDKALQPQVRYDQKPVEQDTQINPFNTFTATNGVNRAQEQPLAEKAIGQEIRSEESEESKYDHDSADLLIKKTQLLSLAEDIGLTSDLYPELGSYQQRDINSLVEQHLVNEFVHTRGGVYAQFDNIERYLEEQSYLVSQYFLEDVMSAASTKGELTQSFAIHLLEKSAEDFEGDSFRTDQLVRLLASSKQSESELVRISTLQALASTTPDKDWLLQELSSFDDDASDAVRAKLTLLRFELDMMQQVQEQNQ